MARRAARVEPSRSGTHPVIIVLLLFSILIAIAMGVLYYLERDKTNQARAAENRLRQELQAKDKRLDMFHNWLLVLALSWCYGENEAIKDGDFAEASRRLVEYLNTPAESRPKDEAIERFMKVHDFLFGTPDKPGVFGPYGRVQAGRLEAYTRKSEAVSLYAEREKAIKVAADWEKKHRDLQAELERVRGEFDQYKAAWNENRLKDELEKQSENHKKELAQKVQEWESRYKSLEEKLRTIHQDLDKRIGELRAAADEKEKQLLMEMNKRLAEMETEVQRIRRAARPRVELLREIQPSGRILSVRLTGDEVTIDRGLIHRLPEGITFNVYPRSPDGRVVPKVKAMIQVVQVNRDSALARVTRVVKPEEIRDPSWDEFDERYWITDPSKFVLLRDLVRPGDFIYNSAWKPNEPVHIALAGLIDLDGDGKDDSQLFKQILKERGVVIDLHLRYVEKQYVVEGRLTDRTDMLVVGFNPFIPPESKPDGEPGKPVVEKDAFEMLEAEARRRGMDVIGVRHFLLQMGFLDLSALVRTGLQEKPAEEQKPPAGKPEGQ